MKIKEYLLGVRMQISWTFPQSNGHNFAVTCVAWLIIELPTTLTIIHFSQISKSSEKRLSI